MIIQAKTMQGNKVVVLLVLLLFSFGTRAALKLPSLVSDHMVLQRNVPIAIWGWAKAGEPVLVTFKDKTYKATADSKGRWKLNMDKCSAGGPFKLIISGASQQITLDDILVGDVWLCSGQSNMGYDFNQPRSRLFYQNDIASSANDKIRQILIARNTSPVPAENANSTGWKSAGSGTLNSFSVVAYFFAKHIFEQYHVPIGLINASWGGTKAEAWMSEDGLKEFPAFKKDILLAKDTAQLALKVKEKQKMIALWHKENRAADQGYKGAEAVWAKTDLIDDNWKKAELQALTAKIDSASVYGVVWYRKTFDIHKKVVGETVTLNLGIVADAAEVFVNSFKVGSFNNGKVISKYEIADSLLLEGKNNITVKLSNWSSTVQKIPVLPMYMEIGAEKISLQGSWEFNIGRSGAPLPTVYKPQTLATSIYNGMIAPLLPYAIRGVVWYQGENNEDNGYEYRRLFPALIANWRTKFNQGDFPFIYQQLVNFRPINTEPSVSKWAELREAQFLNLQKTANTAMAVGIDAGEADDIHPVDKRIVAYRLSLVARKLSYQETSLTSSGPLYKEMNVSNSKIMISFANAGDTLIAKNGALKYFAIAGQDRVFRWAKAEIKDNKIEVWSDAVAAPVAVRYAWADNPEGCNLYNKAGLPASPFRTDDWPGLTFTLK
jgi:sialate O-acetylesterase